MSLFFFGVVILHVFYQWKCNNFNWWDINFVLTHSTRHIPFFYREFLTPFESCFWVAYFFLSVYFALLHTLYFNGIPKFMAGLFGSEVTVRFLGLLYFVHYFNIQKLFVIFFFYILFFHIRQKKKKNICKSLCLNTCITTSSW